MSESKKSLSMPVAVIIAGVIIAGAVFYSKGNTNSNQPQGSGSGDIAQGEQVVAPAPRAKLTVDDNDHIRGNKNAPVTIIEYSDFECSFCAKFHPTILKALGEYGDQVRWVYRHFPLGFHAKATPAAEASECAAEQGKFWQFADGLFENQSRLGSDLYSELAEEFNLNKSQFDECVSSRKYKNIVEADAKQGASEGVSGTPGSFVNGEVIPGAVPYASLKAAIDRAIADL